MLRWCVVEKYRSGAELLTVCENKEAAVEEGDGSWAQLSESDKRNATTFVVGLCNVEEHAPGTWAYVLDASGKDDTEVREVAKKYK